MNIAIRQFEENMVNLINSTPLPIEVKRLAVCEILHKIEIQAGIEMANEHQNKQVEKEE